MTYAIQIAACAAMAITGMVINITAGQAMEKGCDEYASVCLCFSIALITIAILVRP